PTLTCASNKTVQCGTAWSFDAPTAFDACCTNVAITVIGTVTNGVTTTGIVAPCAINYTRTWLATDCCSNTATCSQTVTVISCVPAPSGLVLWLPFDEASGTNTANLYAGGNNGVLIGGPSHNLGSYVENSL